MIPALVGLVLGLLARASLLTIRVRVVSHPSLETSRKPRVLALWHGQLMMLLAHRRRRRTVALVSLSRDGEVLAWGMRPFGVASERGSSSRAGRTGLRAMKERLRAGWDAAFAVDGPRGPSGVAHPGALAAARDTGGLIVPYAAACSRTLGLASWDRFRIPMPFSRIVVVLGEPFEPNLHATTTLLSARIDAASHLANEILRREVRPEMSPYFPHPPASS